MFSEHILFSMSPFSSWRTTSPVTELQAISSQHEIATSLKKMYNTATNFLTPLAWKDPHGSEKNQTNLKTFLYYSIHASFLFFFNGLYYYITFFIVTSLETRCNKGENLCFPINMWIIPKLKAGKWNLGACLYLASSSLTFFFHRDFLNALLCLSKWFLTENICNYCWVGFLLQYGFASAWQVVTYYVVVTQWNIYVTVATSFKIEK